MKIHILGISGTFMSGIAILAKKKGYEVTGSDTSCYDPIKSILEKENISVIKGHKIKDIKDKDLIIIGNVMSRGNTVVEYILKNNMDYVSGPQWLHDNILKYKKVIAVSGTHGKTTTTAMIVHIMKKNKMNPSYLIGGSPKGNFKSVALTSSKYFVIEADEYDTAFFDKRSKFIHYNPFLTVINNIEYDHADIFENIGEIIKSFSHMIRLIPSDGTIIVNKNDLNIKKLLKRGYWSKLKTVDSVKSSGDFNLLKKKQYMLKYNNKNFLLPQNIIGKHNYINAVTAIGVCKELKLPINSQIKALSNFRGVYKRTDLVGEVDGIKVFDDFAHHPTAIKSSINSIKETFIGKRLLTVFVPGSNSMRLGVHDAQLVPSLNKSDRALILTKFKSLKRLIGNNIKINVIETEAQIREYLDKENKFDIILVLSNRNTENIFRYIKR